MARVAVSVPLVVTGEPETEKIAGSDRPTLVTVPVGQAPRLTQPLASSHAQSVSPDLDARPASRVVLVVPVASLVPTMSRVGTRRISTIDAVWAAAGLAMLSPISPTTTLLPRQDIHPRILIVALTLQSVAHARLRRERGERLLLPVRRRGGA